MTGCKVKAEILDELDTKLFEEPNINALGRLVLLDRAPMQIETLTEKLKQVGIAVLGDFLSLSEKFLETHLSPRQEFTFIEIADACTLLQYALALYSKEKKRWTQTPVNGVLHVCRT